MRGTIMALDLNKDINLFNKKKQPKTNDKKEQKDKDSDNGVSYDKKGRVERPIKHWKFVFINDMNKRETGTLDAESEIEVRNFLAGQND